VIPLRCQPQDGYDGIGRFINMNCNQHGRSISEW